jgi:flagellar hook-associated protein 2
MSISLSNISGATTPGSNGLGQGIDVNATVSSILDGERGQETIWQQQQKTMAAQQADLVQINSEISAFQQAFQSLHDATGALSSKSVTSSQSGIVSASADPTAVAGNHVVVVQSLAITASYYTDAVASATTTLAQGSFTVQVGNGTVNTVMIDSTDNTLTGLANTINAANAGVTASVVNDASGARLALVSQTSGAAGAITIGSNSSGLNFNQANAGANASLTVDGVPISSASNSVTGVIPGVTLNLNSASPGTQVAVSVSANTQDIQTALGNFVSAYNAIVNQINTEFAYNAAAGSAGNLSGDSGLRQIQQQLLGDIASSTTGNGAVNSLADLGVSMNNDGTLTLDNGKLNDALTNHYADVQNFFQSTATGTFAQQLNNDLQTMTDSTQGALYLEINGLRQSQQDVQKQIDDFESNLQSQQQELLLVYSQLNATLQGIPLTMQQLNAQLSSLSSSK